MENTKLKIQNLSHQYTSQWAVKDVSFDIIKNGVIGLLGSNGAGKSTLMNAMCGALYQTKGEIFINGINIRKNPKEAKKQLGFLPQKAPLHLDLTVDEYLLHCAKLRLIKKEEIYEAIAEAKTKCGIMHFSDRLLRNLSGGYQQRVGIAQAIVHKPPFVVLDEPTNGLDPNQILEVRNLIKNIAKECSVLISTHILSEVEAICDHIKMIENGIMVFEGTMEEFHNVIESNAILVKMKSPPAESELEKLEGIDTVELLNKKSGLYRFKVDNDENLLENIIKQSIKSNWRLYEINYEKASLEETFATLSKKEFINK
ncbi:ABC transporter ATP-binding protein [Polaribacter porphyrae]|uniref:Multidrug ABC transporter ATP-binding protein n=1 Tax=Polaribacter porphyrae TaxID=1137780 RepID=A0A2S7WTM8_9FLAO|nr:ABC transporter ATP-binding protein [Polaribacter porphyrae]PQJ80945.1 multidrug ABC transporter ATP-binding protein [Polaribacter porphyrae]